MLFCQIEEVANAPDVDMRLLWGIFGGMVKVVFYSGGSGADLRGSIVELVGKKGWGKRRLG